VSLALETHGLRQLLEAGAQISECQPTMFHCKVFTVDGLLVSVGSTNFDNRSFRLNDEADLNVYDEAFAAAQTLQFEADLSQSKRLTLKAWQNRPLAENSWNTPPRCCRHSFELRQ